MDWLRRLLGMPQTPRETELQTMLDHIRWQHERDMAVVDRLVGTMDRVVASRFDRPQTAKEDIPPMRQQFTPDDLTDILYAKTDEEFFTKVDQVTQ